jgi:tripartite-type tricarboxylate transporter receptor subunit TctC
MCAAVASQVIGPQLYKKLTTYDTFKDFTPISLFAITQNVLVVNPKTPYKSVKDLIAYAKANPGKLNFASVGNGSSSHLNAELLKSMAGIDAVHVPFNGSPPAVLSTVQGETQMIFAVMQPLQAQIQAGKLRPIAVTTPKRFPLLPDLPSIAESGYPGFEALAWNGLVVPSATPRAVVDKINAEVNAILKQPDVAQKMNGFGFDLIGGKPEDFGALIRSEAERWTPIVTKLGIKQG